MWECVACDIGCFLPRRLCAAVTHSRRIRARSVLRASCLGLVSDCANWPLMHPPECHCLQHTSTFLQVLHCLDKSPCGRWPDRQGSCFSDGRQMSGSETLPGQRGSCQTAGYPLRLRSHPRQSGKKQHYNDRRPRRPPPYHIKLRDRDPIHGVRGIWGRAPRPGLGRLSRGDHRMLRRTRPYVISRSRHLNATTPTKDACTKSLVGSLLRDELFSLPSQE